MRPIEIVGGGLAGLGLGIALRHHDVPVTIYEAGNYPRHRVCGEFITSLDNDTRAALRLNEILSRAQPARNVAWCEDGKKDIEHDLPQPALCLSRHALDHAMAGTFVSLGGDLRTGARKECSNEPGRVHACGRRPDSSSAWIGIKQHFRNLETRKDLEVHFGRGGYIGLTRVDGEKVNVCGLLRRGSADFTESFSVIAARAGFVKLSRRLAGAEPLLDSLCAVAGLDYNPSTHDGFLRIGDRAGLIPPFTGNGMTIALQSAVAAERPLTAWSRGQIGWSAARAGTLRAHKTLFGARCQTARALHPLLLHPGTRSFARGLHRLGVLPVGFLYRLMH